MVDSKPESLDKLTGLPSGGLGSFSSPWALINLGPIYQGHYALYDAYCQYEVETQ